MGSSKSTRCRTRFVLGPKVFIDESYDQKIFVLSCTVGLGERWDSFEREWDSVLNEVNTKLAAQGRQKISRYHAT